MKAKEKTILAVGAHPDDVEFMCSGLLGMLRDKGFEIHVATMTCGDCGSMHERPAKISEVRRSEAEAACQVLGAQYHHLDFTDFCIFNDDISNRRVTALIRDVNPFIVVTHPPQDYLSDHEVTSGLVRNACFYAPVPNYSTSKWTSAVHVSSIPYLYYAHPMEGVDLFGNTTTPHLYIDVTDKLSLKVRMLSCHRSQRDWLRVQHGMDDYVDGMKRWSHTLGQEASRLSGWTVEFAEAYRQHRGHAYPTTALLTKLLDKAVILVPAVPGSRNGASGPQA
jgi:N-acetylglucosamine malate deacetylase 1